MTPNGALFNTQKQGFLTVFIAKMYEDRVKYKQYMLEAKQKDIKLLSEFFNSGTHKVFDYRDIDYVQIIIPSSLQRKITNLYKEAGYDEDYPLDEDLESHLKEPKQYEDTSDAIGGIEAVVPTEGLVFKYNGNTYKFTGTFAPVNQITGLLKFSR